MIMRWTFSMNVKSGWTLSKKARIPKNMSPSLLAQCLFGKSSRPNRRMLLLSLSAWRRLCLSRNRCGRALGGVLNPSHCSRPPTLSTSWRLLAVSIWKSSPTCRRRRTRAGAFPRNSKAVDRSRLCSRHTEEHGTIRSSVSRDSLPTAWRISSSSKSETSIFRKLIPLIRANCIGTRSWRSAGASHLRPWPCTGLKIVGSTFYP
mmetsp:Transcript_118868/g.341372  ORF Transcript_118868/g.341372 Transcript_118868/m.341372 type:complete len:204 (+) Transcript_118868:1980-2591(+)